MNETNLPEDYALFLIAEKGEAACQEAYRLLSAFLQGEQQRYDLRIVNLKSAPAVRAEIAIPMARKHDLRIGLNLFAAETNTDWLLESLLPSFHA